MFFSWPYEQTQVFTMFYAIEYGPPAEGFRLSKMLNLLQEKELINILQKNS